MNEFREEIKGKKAAAEISFSKLKLIETYLRSMMAQERLLGVSILFMENEEARSVNKGRLLALLLI